MRKGSKMTERQRQNVSKSLKGRIVWNKGLKGAQSAWNKGLKTPESVKEKQSIARLGKKLTKESIVKRQETRKLNGNWDKKFGIGDHHSEKSKKAIRAALWGNKYALGNKQTDEWKKNARERKIEQIKKNYGIALPNYNKFACEFFKHFDEIHNTKGHYAMYGGGEWYIEELGYWPDYINFELKLIIEWDEGRHFNPDGSLRERDIHRQEEIKKIYPDFKFLRINSVTSKIMRA